MQSCLRVCRVDAYRSDILDGMEICNLCHKKTQCQYQQSKRIVLNWQSLCTKTTMSKPTIQTHRIELAIFVTKNTMSIPTIQAHCIELSQKTQCQYQQSKRIVLNWQSLSQKPQCQYQPSKTPYTVLTCWMVWKLCMVCHVGNNISEK